MLTYSCLEGLLSLCMVHAASVHSALSVLTVRELSCSSLWCSTLFWTCPCFLCNSCESRPSFHHSPILCLSVYSSPRPLCLTCFLFLSLSLSLLLSPLLLSFFPLPPGCSSFFSSLPPHLPLIRSLHSLRSCRSRSSSRRHARSRPGNTRHCAHTCWRPRPKLSTRAC